MRLGAFASSGGIAPSSALFAALSTRRRVRFPSDAGSSPVMKFEETSSTSRFTEGWYTARSTASFKPQRLGHSMAHT